MNFEYKVEREKKNTGKNWVQLLRWQHIPIPAQRIYLRIWSSKKEIPFGEKRKRRKYCCQRKLIPPLANTLRCLRTLLTNQQETRGRRERLSHVKESYQQSLGSSQSMKCCSSKLVRPGYQDPTDKLHPQYLDAVIFAITSLLIY